MKSIKLKPLVIIVFLAMTFIANAQLIDPFGKVITHEIKLKKLKDGTRAGAIEWTTGGLDSLQRFIIKGLDIKAPVMVRIISKAPGHNIDLGFYKKNWDKLESKISTNGEKFADKVFRTMNIAGLGVYSKVAGIPYLITVKVGLQFPSTQSLIRITDNKEEYAQHMRKMGFFGQLFEDDNSNSSTSFSGDSNNSNGDNSALTYIIIGLLSIIIILLAVFLLKRKSTKNTTLILILLYSTQFCIAQTSQPKLVPIDGQGNSPVFYEYRTSNVGNQVPVETVMNIGVADMVVAGDTSLETVLVRLDTAPGVRELTGEEAAEVLRRIKEANEQFDRDYGEGSPGEGAQGNQRTLPTDRTNEELNRLRRQVQQLQQQVDLLSQEDEEFDSDYDEGDEILLYCEDIDACRSCLDTNIQKFNIHLANWNYLQRFYSKEMTRLTDQIAYANAMASLPGFGVGWASVSITIVRPAMKMLKEAYKKKFNEYIQSMEADLEAIGACVRESPTRGSYEMQAFSIINSLKAVMINR